jgi:hypothetical protein
VTLFRRLRKDASLWSVPPVVPEGERGPGRPRPYGTQAVSLAKRAGHARGWQTAAVEQYGRRVTKTFKTFVATWRPAGGAPRVVLVQEDDEPGGWVAFCCTDPDMPAQTVREVMARRGTIETAQADYPSRRRWGGARRIGYHRRNGVARVGRVVPATPGRSQRRSRMSDTPRRPAPPRA